MTINQVREYLSRYKYLHIEIMAKTNEIQQIKERAQSINSLDYSTDRVQTSKKREAKFEELMCKAIDMELISLDDLNKLYDTKREIEEIIDKVSDSKQRIILMLLYINDKKIYEIAEMLNYDSATISRIHNKALRTVQNKLNN
ncbi:DUF1492 domain-containing protein [Helcococcus kunzii]|uniref:DUF1492 domain-containing protein n=1 Tax=Helcococcus kunzii TaxID=40091 RepID=UPI0038A7B075